MNEGMFSHMQHAALGAWQRALEDQMQRTRAVYTRIAEIEHRTNGQAQAAIDEWARLCKETLSYQLEIASEWRKLSLETMAKLAALAPVATPAAAPAAAPAAKA